MLKLSEAFLKEISKSTGISPDELKTKIKSWGDAGRSNDCIKRILSLTALARGKKLCFVSPKGIN